MENDSFFFSLSPFCSLLIRRKTIFDCNWKLLDEFLWFTDFSITTLSLFSHWLHSGINWYKRLLTFNNNMNWQPRKSSKNWNEIYNHFEKCSVQTGGHILLSIGIGKSMAFFFSSSISFLLWYALFRSFRSHSKSVCLELNENMFYEWIW